MSEDEAKIPIWVKVLLTVIPVLGTIIVGYWQFADKTPQPDQVKTFLYTGRVTDNQTNNPIYQAKIRIEEEQKVPEIQETDSEGIFRVNLPSTTREVRILVNAAGYKPHDRIVSPTRTGIENIKLDPSGTPTPTATQSPSPLPSIAPNRPGRTNSNPKRRVVSGNCNSEDILVGRC